MVIWAARVRAVVVLGSEGHGNCSEGPGSAPRDRSLAFSPHSSARGVRGGRGLDPGRAPVQPLPAGTARPPQLPRLGPPFPAGGAHQTRMSSGAQAGRSSSILPVTPLSAEAREASAPAAGPHGHGHGSGPGPGPPYLGSGAAGWDRPRRIGRGAGRAAPCPTVAGRCGRRRSRGAPRTARAWRERPSGSPSRTATAHALPARGSGAQ